MAYAANTLVMAAIAVLFRYADFIAVLGGTELHLGWIVGIGMIGSILARFSLGAAIDQRGPRLIWLGSLVVFVATCFAHLGIGRCDGPAIYLLRVLYCTSTAGFVGSMLGTQLGDVLVAGQSIDRGQVDRMFAAAGLLGLAAFPFAWIATRGLRSPQPPDHPAILSVLRRYQPGFVLVVGVGTGAALSLPQTFLRTYAAELDIPRISIFFSVVAATAVLTRIVTRRLPERVGLTAMIFVGLGLMALAQILFLAVRSELQLALPGLPYGIAQAILYPMVAAAATSTFPVRYRGLGITLVLAAFDVGQLLGAPLAGGILDLSRLAGLSSYSMLFSVTAAMLVLVGGAYAWALQRGRAVRDQAHRPAILRVPPSLLERRSVAAEEEAVPAEAPGAITSRALAGSSRSTAAARR